MFTVRKLKAQYTVQAIYSVNKTRNTQKGFNSENVSTEKHFKFSISTKCILYPYIPVTSWF